jgi:UDP-N-acetylmuramoyl-tripeptide--D-alanyl-D-alanine ligase
VAAQGAVAAMVDRAWAATNPVPLPLLVVEDTRLGSATLAAGWRARFALPLIGVTGSNGKTTVKEMCAAILRAQARIDGFDPDLGAGHPRQPEQRHRPAADAARLSATIARP